jgi:hypothetical protein
MATLRFKCLSGEHTRPMRHRHSVAKLLFAQYIDGTHLHAHQVVSQAMHTFIEIPLERHGETMKTGEVDEQLAAFEKPSSFVKTHT